jgi:hypothetical protein
LSCLLFTTDAFAQGARAAGLVLADVPLGAAKMPPPRSAGDASDPRVTELERSLDLVYSEVEALRRKQETTPGEMIAIGTGAGVGLVVGTAAAGIVVVPVALGMATTAGLSSGWASALGAAMGTVTTVAFTLGGGTVGGSLVD